MLLLAGALEAETSPLQSLFSNIIVRHENLILGTCYGLEVALLTTGVGSKKAKEHCCSVIEQQSVTHVISIGTCGALQDEFTMGQVVTGRKIFNESNDSVSIDPLHGFPVVSIVTVDKPVVDPSQRAQLGQYAQVCEMEAFGVFEAAAGISVGALKVVSDQAGKEYDPAMGKDNLKNGFALFRERARMLSTQKLKPALARYFLSQK